MRNFWVPFRFHTHATPATESNLLENVIAVMKMCCKNLIITPLCYTLHTYVHTYIQLLIIIAVIIIIIVIMLSVMKIKKFGFYLSAVMWCKVLFREGGKMNFLCTYILTYTEVIRVLRRKWWWSIWTDSKQCLAKWNGRGALFKRFFKMLFRTKLRREANSVLLLYFSFMFCLRQKFFGFFYVIFFFYSFGDCNSRKVWVVCCNSDGQGSSTSSTNINQHRPSAWICQPLLVYSLHENRSS